MAYATFGQVWRTVRLHCPDAPAMLVRDWVQSAYAELFDYRPWAWTLTQGQITYQASRTFDVTVTMGSTTVTSAALFLSSDAGRQFRVGTYPIYTIQQVVDTSTILLSLAYQGDEPETLPSGTVEGTVLDAYATLPEDFGAFTALVDPVNQRWVPWWGTQEELDILDPTRTSADSTPRLLCSAQLSVYPPELGQAQYEYWPKPTAAGSLSYYMRKRPAQLADDDPFQGALAHRGDVIQDGALAQAARWPGTTERKNPYFNIQLAREYDERFRKGILQLDLRDDDMYYQSTNAVPWQRWQAWSWAYDTRLLQQTDATLGAYFGYGAYPAVGY